MPQIGNPLGGDLALRTQPVQLASVVSAASRAMAPRDNHASVDTLNDPIAQARIDDPTRIPATETTTDT